MVYVLDVHGHPLMPTKRFGKVRRWLKQGQARVVGHSPFTIKFLIETGSYVQPLTLGVDTGYQTVGVSVISSAQELLSAEIQLRNEKKKKLAEIIELSDKNHPFYIGTQGHPEYKSKPLKPHPIFLAFVKACQHIK